MAPALTRESYEGLQRAEFDRRGAVAAENVLVNSPARFGQHLLTA